MPVLAQADHPVADQLTFFFHLSICSVVVAAGLVFFSWELLEVVSVPLVWAIGTLLNGFMALPNLIALIFLVGTVRSLTRDYFDKPSRQSR